MKTVFIPPIVNWTFLRQLPQQIASQFAKNGYRVLFCNERAFANDLKKVEVEPNLTVYPNIEYALHEINKLKIDIDIFYTTAAMTYKYVEQVKPKMVLYHSCDSFDQWKKIEPQMIEIADIIYCTSKYIYDLRKSQHDKVYLVMNGCNEDMIDKKDYVISDTLKFVKSPICIFSGACGWWVSTYLIRNVAKEYYTILLGQEFGRKMPDNVMYQPSLLHEQMTNYLYNTNIGLLPFNVKLEVTQAANPIKMWEYMACGLPVVSTKWAETDREELKDVVWTAETDEEYMEIVKKYASASDSYKEEIKEVCFEIARNNTWEKRFEIIEGSMEGVR